MYQKRIAEIEARKAEIAKEIEGADEQRTKELDTEVDGLNAELATLRSKQAVANKLTEIHGSEGTLAVPDPNLFDGEVSVHRLGGEGWETLPVTAGYESASRVIGLQDMATRGAELRASGQLGQHALEVMNAVLESSGSGRRVEIESTVARPEAVVLEARVG